MTVTLKRDLAGVDWRALAGVYARTLSPEDPEELRRTWSRSFAACLAYHDETLAGAARAVSDGEREGAIFGVAALPEFQRRGIGARMMQALLDELGRAAVLLTCEGELETFYRKLDFLKHRSVFALHYPEGRLEPPGAPPPSHTSNAKAGDTRIVL